LEYADHGPGALDSVRKLDPRWMVKNPVMFVVEVGSVLTSALLIDNFRHHRFPAFGFNLQITLWLWFTVLFANFAEAMAEGRGKAQADTLRKAKGETIAKRYKADGSFEEVVSGSASRRRRDLRRSRQATSPATAK
jgi:potassium-transporting ATPase ATP-binding subunit